jgi:hypothetical protein
LRNYQILIATSNNVHTGVRQIRRQISRIGAGDSQLGNHRC